MNAKQRNKNRLTARWLSQQKPCPECGELGPHFIQEPMTLSELLGGQSPRGFWTCAKFYGADGRRLPEHTSTPDYGAQLLALL